MSQPKRFDLALSQYLKAGFPLLWVPTHEERRAEDDIRSVANAIRPARVVYVWTTTDGWIGPDGKPLAAQTPTTDPSAALKQIRQQPLPENALYVLKDLHPFLANATVIRRIRDLLPWCKPSGRHLILLTPSTSIPPELEKDVQIVPFTLPDREGLSKILDVILDSVGDRARITVERNTLLDAARGLTSSEAESVFALTLVRHLAAGGFGLEAVATIQAEKAASVKKQGILEFLEPEVTLDDIAGLGNLKAWLQLRARAFSDEAAAFGLPFPRGVLAVGVPGTGKSLMAKAVAAAWNRPLIRLDMGRLFNPLVGRSEETARKVIEMAEAVAPCILWIDEIEKGVAGMNSSGQTDSGTTSRVMGTIMTWMSEKTSPVFVFATANDITRLEGAFIRKGRFDEVFAVTLPTTRERRAAFEIHLRKRARDPALFALDPLVQATREFSGSEIEAAVIGGLFRAFGAGHDLTTDDLLAEITSTKPLAATSREQVDTVKRWIAEDRAKVASDDVDEPAVEQLPSRPVQQIRRMGLDPLGADAT